VECVSFDNAEEVVVAGAQGGTVKLWDLEQAKGPCLSVTHSCCINALECNLGAGIMTSSHGVSCYSAA